MYPTTCLNDHTVTSLVDADIVAYRAAAIQQANDLEEYATRACVLRLAESWTKWGQETIMCLSKGRSFRYEAYPQYKHNRKDKPKPPTLEFCQQVIRDNYKVQEKDTWEADDVMGVLATCGQLECPLIVTVDKDLRQVPGWHWNPDKEQWPCWVTPEQGDYLTHLQWLTGDSTDGYGGIPKVGLVKAQKALQAGLEDSQEYLEIIRAEYEKADLDNSYMDSMHTCCKILQAK